MGCGRSLPLHPSSRSWKAVRFRSCRPCSPSRYSPHCARCSPSSTGAALLRQRIFASNSKSPPSLAPRLPHLGRRSRIAPGRLAPVFLVRDLPCSTQAYAACHDTAVQRCLRPVTTGMADLGCAELRNTHLLRTRPPGLMSCAMSRRDAFSPATSLALSHCPLPGTPW